MTDLPDNNRFAPPRAQLADHHDDSTGLVLAGRGQRFVAVILDGVLMCLVVYPLFFAFGGSLFAHIDPAAPPDPFAMMGQMFRAMVPGYIVAFAVQAWCLHAYGGTLAKKLLGLRIVRTDGSRATAVRLIFGRGAAAIVPAMIPLLGALYTLVDSLLIFRDSRQCIHDQIADTIVVTAASSMGASLAASRGA
ncbi:MAG: RDD family protein [Burkholderiaceae bacterium]|jgi:uncharacterized RDD family membrane protein YckC